MEGHSRFMIDEVAARDIRFRGITLQDALDKLENENDEIESIFIEPPDPALHSDEHSAGEDEGGLVDNLSGRQLSCQAEIVYKHNVDSGENDYGKLPPKSKKLKKNAYKWEEKDMSDKRSFFPEPNYQQYAEKSPVELFELFIDCKFIELILLESARYSTSKNEKDPAFSSEEIRVFIGILFLSGYVTVPSKRSYWESAEDMRNSLAYNAMRRARFLEICRFIHFVDNTMIDQNDKMWKLRPIIGLLQEKCLQHFVPEEHLSYDECMIAYYGKHSCKQFIKTKPIRFGYKAWCLNTANGYLLNFDLYQGKSIQQNEEYENIYGKAATPLLQMLDGLPVHVACLPFKIYFDNLFTGLPLLINLQDRGYGATGTVRENRVPKECSLIPSKVLKKHGRGMFDFKKICDKDIVFSRWVDNSVITVASNVHGVQPVSKVQRYSRAEKKTISVSQPSLIGYYNQYMGGTDRMDQNVACHRISFRGKKWYWSIFTRLLDVAAQNAWYLSRKCGGNMSQLEFKRAIVMAYLVTFKNPPKGGGRPSTNASTSSTMVADHVRFDGRSHLVQQCSRRRCQGEKCKSTVRTECCKCNVGLCIPCFKTFHGK